MPTVRVIETTAQQWALQHGMRAVRDAAGAVNVPQQAACSGDAGVYRALPGGRWAGASHGVRAPGPGETPLSYEEVAFGVQKGIL